MTHRDISAAGVEAFRAFVREKGWSVLLERDLDYGVQLQVSEMNLGRVTTSVPL